VFADLNAAVAHWSIREGQRKFAMPLLKELERAEYARFMAEHDAGVANAKAVRAQLNGLPSAAA